MIQRIQTLWLLLAAACVFATFKFPYYSGTNAKNIADQELTATGSLLIMIITIAIGGLALFTISLYKKRKLQLLLCVAGILLEAVLIFLYYTESQTFLKGTLAFTAILHGLIVFLFFIAAKAINKDEKLVKDSDRLR